MWEDAWERGNQDFLNGNHENPYDPIKERDDFVDWADGYNTAYKYHTRSSGDNSWYQ